MPSSLKYRPKVLAHTGVLTKEDLSRIYTDDDVINELEKIKEEIEEIDNIVHEHGATYINKYGITSGSHFSVVTLFNSST